MADKPDVAAVAAFDKSKLKTVKTAEKNVLPTAEYVQREEEGKESSRMSHCGTGGNASETLGSRRKAEEDDER